MTKKTETADPSVVRLPERLWLARKLATTNASLRTLASVTPEALRTVTDESVEEIMRRLVEERSALWSELAELPLPDLPPAVPPVARDAQRTKAAPARGFRSLFSNGPCRKADESFHALAPVEADFNFRLVPQTPPPAYSWFDDFGVRVPSPPNVMLGGFRIHDPNNDPFNSDANGVFVAAYWKYELPEAPFTTRYELSASTGIRVDVNGSSNHGLGGWYWGFHLDGFMAFTDDSGLLYINFGEPEQYDILDGELVLVGNKPIDEEMAFPPAETPFDTGLVSMTRQIDVAAGASPPDVFIVLQMLFWVDRGSMSTLLRADHGDDAFLDCRLTYED